MLDSEKTKAQLIDELNELREKLNHSRIESEENYRLIFESSMDGILITDLEGKIYHANPAATEILGWSEEEIRNLGRDGIVDPGDTNLSIALQERDRTGRFFKELKHRRKDGTTFPAGVTSRLFKLKDGSVRTCTIIRDITEKKVMQEAISASERHFKALIQNSSDVTVLLGLDGIINYISTSVTSVVGYLPEEMLHENAFQWIHPEDRPRIVELFGHVLESKSEAVKAQMRALHKNNYYIWIEATATNYTDEPAINAIVVNYRDIDESKKAELKLIESESRYRALASNFPNGFVVLFDKNLRYILVEGSELARLGLTKDYLEGKTIFELFPEDICAVLDTNYRATFEGKENVFELSFKNNTYELRTIPIKNEQGDIIVGMTMVQNISDRKRTEKQLKELNDSKDKFFSIVAHDLKSPFSSLIGFSEFLVSDFDDLSSEEIKSFTANIHRSAKGVFNLLENLLQWSRLQTGRMDFTPICFYLNELIDQTIHIYQFNAIKKNINIEFDAGKDVQVFADKYMIDTVVRNILSNSIKFTNPGGDISIKLVPEEKNVRVVITDNGIGISEENLDKLFRLGERVTTPGTKNEKGTGLGLILCREFIEKNNGSLAIQSQPGKGTTFTFILPSCGS